MNQTMTTTAYSATSVAARPSFGTGMVAFLVASAKRMKQRQELAELDERMLKDCGISKADQVREAGKPFWAV